MEQAKLAISLCKKFGLRERLGFAYRNEGIASFILGDTENALRAANEALVYFKDQGIKSGELTLYMLVGGIYFKRGKYQVALENQLKALSIRQESGDKKGEAELRNNIGSIYIQLGQFDEALEHLLKALNICDDLGTDLTMASVLNNVCGVYQRLGHFETALSYLNRALPIYERTNDRNRVALVLANIGRLHHLNENLDKALDTFVRSLQLRKQVGDLTGVAVTLQQMGNIYFEMEDFDTSAKYQAKSLEFYRHQSHREGEISALLHLGRIARKTYEDAKAESCFRESLEKARAQKDLNSEVRIHEELASLYEDQHDFEKALVHFKSHTKLKDSLLSLEKQKAVAAIEFRYDMDREKREKEIYRLKNVELKQAVDSLEKVQSELEEKNLSLEAAYEEVKIQQARTSKANGALEEMNVELSSINTKLRSVSEEKSDLMSVVAHDLKNPLTGIMLSADTMRHYIDRLKKEEVLKFVGSIEARSQQMMELISNLLHANALESGALAYTLESFGAETVVCDVVEQMQERASKKDIQLQLDTIGDDFSIEVDKDRYREIIENVVSNAVKYSPLNSMVTIRIIETQKKVTCVVKDQGPGISTEEQQQLFKKFSRLSSKPTGGESSTGLGLAICKKLCDQMHGEISCISEFGTGAAFYIEFPKTVSFSELQ